MSNFSRHRGRGPRQELRRHARRRRRRPVRRAGRGVRGPRAQRRRQDHHDPDARHPAGAGCRPRLGARPRHRLRGRHRPLAREPDGPARLGRRGPHRAREPRADGAAARPRPGRGARARQRAAGGVRARRRRQPPGQELLGRDAPAPGHRGEHRRHAAADVPRRADDRPGPALAQPGLGHRARARRPGHDRAAVHPVPRGGRPARRPDRGDRPRPRDRRGHAGAAEGVGRARRAARAPARPGSSARAPPSCSATRRTSSPIPPRSSLPGAGAEQASEAIAALVAAGIGVAGFSLGQPSLDEVFLALTGHPAEDSEPEEVAA